MLRRTIGSTRRKPTIIVPGAFLFVLYVFFSHICYQLIAGSPVLWTERFIPFTLRPDDGFVYVDQYIMTVRDCPNIRCCHFLPLRTRYIARRWHHLSTGRLWTSSRTETACASSCSGLTHLQAERCSTSGSTSSLSGPRPSCYAAGNPHK